VSCGGFEGDSVAEVLEFADVVAHLAVEVDAGVVLVGAEVVEAGVLFVEEVPDDDQDGPADGDDCSLLTAPSGDASVALAEESVGAGGRDGGLAQDSG
jgi:hypothetical protein